jgi:hypothetical protein
MRRSSCALIIGAGDLIKPAAPNLVMLGAALSYFAAWYILGVIGLWAFGFEPKGRTFKRSPTRTICWRRQLSQEVAHPSSSTEALSPTDVAAWLQGSGLERMRRCLATTR